MTSNSLSRGLRLARAFPILAFAFVCVAVSATAAPLRAHTEAPAVIGTVVDTAGIPLANAMVIVAEVGRTTTTNAAGIFALRGLPAGEYHLNVVLFGFAPGHVVVRVPPEGEDVRITVRLVQTPLRLTSIVVSASPAGTEADRLTQAALELSGRALSRAVGSSVASTLSGEPGVSQRFSGPAASMPVIRGLTGDRILILQDGERAGDLASSAADHAVSVDPLAAQRIEVVRGPSSLLYGNNALGGVVNVVSNDIPTAVPSHLEGYIGTQGETATPGGALSAGVTAALGTKSAVSARVGYREMGALRTGGGVTLDDTDSRAANATLGYGYIGDRAHLGLALRYYDFTYGLPAEAGDPEAGVRLDGRRVGLSARGGFQLRGAAIPYLRIEGTAQDYTHDEIEPGGDIGTTFRLGTQTVNARATTTWGAFRGAIGVQGLFKQYDATGEEALTPGANSLGIGAFLYQEVPLRGSFGAHDGGPQLQLGARWDSYRVATEAGEAKFGPARTTDFGNVSGSVGLSVPVTDAVTVSGSVARAFRAPMVEELHSHGLHAAAGTYDIGNPDLTAETSLGAEAIVRVRGARVSAQVAAYTNRVNDYITPMIFPDTVVDGESVPLVRFGQEDATLTGLEGTLEAHLTGGIVASVMGDLVRAEFASGGVLPFIPPARVGAGLRWESRGSFVAGDVRHGFGQDRVTGGAVDVATDDYTVLNLSAGRQWIIGNVLHQVTLRADNVADARYFDAASRIKRFAANPGRNITLVYQLQF